MLKALMIPMFHDMKSLIKLNTFGTLNCGGNEIESSEFITDCNALFVAGVQTALAAAEGQMLSAMRTILYLCGGKIKPFKAERAAY